MAKKMGRPVTMTRFVASKVYRMAAFGMKDEDISEVLEISIDTIEKAKKDADFIGYLSRARENEIMIAKRSIAMLARGMTITERRTGTSDGKEIDILIEREIPPSLPACESILRRYAPDEYKGDNQNTLIQIFKAVRDTEQKRIVEGESPMEVLFSEDFRSKMEAKKITFNGHTNGMNGHNGNGNGAH